jgi:hypothetical protein
MNPKTHIFTKIVYLIVAVIGLVVAPVALAQAEAKLSLQPVASDEGNLVLEVIAENVTDMYGAEVQLTYDPAILAVQDTNPDQDGVQIEPGTLLPADQGFVVANQVNEAEGTITFAMTLLNPAPAVNGAGPLVRVAFKALQNSPTTIDIAHAKLVSIDLQTIPNQTQSFSVSPETTTNDPTASTVANSAGGGFPWWLIAGAIILLGGIALGSLMIMGNSKQTATPPARPTPNPKPALPVDAPQTRPSAFKQQTFPPDAPQKQG